MAFPVVETTNTSAETTIVATHNISLPAGIVSGNLLIATLGYAVTGNTITWPAGWTAFAAIENTTGSTEGISVAYRQADGTEGATVDVTSSVATRSTHTAYRISGAENPATQAPQAATASTTNLPPDPPNLTPTGGAKDYLWLAIGASAQGGTYPSFSTNYINGIQINTGGTGAGDSISGSCERQLNAASENPGAFGANSATAESVAVTVAIHPAAAAPKSLVAPRRISSGVIAR